jgi:hypothetical protein
MESLYNKIKTFYQDKNNMNILLDILVEKNISMRKIEYFITTFSKKYSILINKDFIVYKRYREKLQGYTKKYFEFFCRGDKIKFYYNHEDYIITTIGQLHACKWIIENNIYDFVKHNIDLINKDIQDKIKNIEIQELKNSIVVKFNLFS